MDGGHGPRATENIQYHTNESKRKELRQREAPRERPFFSVNLLDRLIIATESIDSM